MLTKKLNNIDFSPLWENPHQLCTIRFQDINEQSKRILTTRIKETARQHTIRKRNGPSIQIIYEILTEINPIIFSESLQEENNRWYPKSSYRNFNKNQAYSIDSYNFKNLCQAIYYISSLKKPLSKFQIQKIGQTVHSNWSKIHEYIERNYHPELNPRTEEETQTPNNDIGILDIERARTSAEQNGADNIPIEMQETPKKITKKYDILEILNNPEIVRIFQEN